MKKDKFKRIVPLSLSTILTLMPTANALAAPGDILNESNNKEYDVNSLNYILFLDHSVFQMTLGLIHMEEFQDKNHIFQKI